MINKILILSDFSPASWEATRCAIDIAKATNAKISILHVVPCNEKIQEDWKTESKINRLREKIISITTPLMENSRSQMDVVVLCGNTKSKMMDFVRSNAFDLIFMGKNSDIESDEIGSHTKRILEKNDVPVMVVSDKREAKTCNGTCEKCRAKVLK